jgi:hypothetical protein
VHRLVFYLIVVKLPAQAEFHIRLLRARQAALIRAERNPRLLSDASQQPQR